MGSQLRCQELWDPGGPQEQRVLDPEDPGACARDKVVDTSASTFAWLLDGAASPLSVLMMELSCSLARENALSDLLKPLTRNSILKISKNAI